MSGGKGNANTISTVRYPPYVESHHAWYLNVVETYVLDMLDVQWRHGSPYWFFAWPEGDDWVDLHELMEAAFFGTGFTLSSFPSLYDMYGKFMAGLDIEVLFDEVFQDTINGPVVDNLVSAEADVLSDDLENEAYPRFEAGMRDINSVMSSSFLVGKAMMEVGRTKALARFSAEFRARLLPLVTERWSQHLKWNSSVIEIYAQLMKFYLTAKFDVDNHILELRAKDRLWPFTVLQYEGAALGALTGAANTETDVKGASKASKAVGGALMGGAMGGMIAGASEGAIAGPVGIMIGAVLGLAGGLL